MYPITAGPDYIRFLHFLLEHQILNMLKIKRDINQQDLKIVDLHFVESEEFSLTWSCGSHQRDTTSSEWKSQLNNLAAGETVNMSSTLVAGCRPRCPYRKVVLRADRGGGGGMSCIPKQNIFKKHNLSFKMTYFLQDLFSCTLPECMLQSQ